MKLLQITVWILLVFIGQGLCIQCYYCHKKDCVSNTPEKLECEPDQICYIYASTTGARYGCVDSFKFKEMCSDPSYPAIYCKACNTNLCNERPKTVYNKPVGVINCSDCDASVKGNAFCDVEYEEVRCIYPFKSCAIFGGDSNEEKKYGCVDTCKDVRWKNCMMCQEHLCNHPNTSESGASESSNVAEHVRIRKLYLVFIFLAFININQSLNDSRN